MVPTAIKAVYENDPVVERPKVRITIFINGDYNNGGRAMSFDDTYTIQDLLANAKLRLAPTTVQPFVRIFNDVGEEITDISQIQNGDYLCFSYGEDLIISNTDDDNQAPVTPAPVPTMAPSAPVTSVSNEQQQYQASPDYVVDPYQYNNQPVQQVNTVEQQPQYQQTQQQQPPQQQQPKPLGMPPPTNFVPAPYTAPAPKPTGGFFRKALNFTVDSVSTGYNYASTAVKVHGPSSIANSLPQFEDKVAGSTAGFRATVSSATNNAVDWADSKVEVAAQKKDEFMASETGQKMQQKTRSLFGLVRSKPAIPEDEQNVPQQNSSVNSDIPPAGYY